MSVLKREVVSHSVKICKGRAQKLLLSSLLLGGRMRKEVTRNCDHGLSADGIVLSIPEKKPEAASSACKTWMFTEPPHR